jgi:hypothetical protein
MGGQDKPNQQPGTPRRGGDHTADRTLTEMQQLEAMAVKLLETARKLPARPVRHDILKEIRKFRVRIAALKAKGK